MKLDESRRDVVVLGTALQLDSCECVLDTLQLGEIGSRHPNEQKVAVIESGTNYIFVINNNINNTNIIT